MTPATSQTRGESFRAKSARAVSLSVVMAVALVAFRSLAAEPSGENPIRLADLPEKPASFFEASFSLEISHREIESEAEKPQFDSDYDGVTVKLSSILRRVSPSDDVISKLLVQGSIASKGALAFGGLRVGY